MLTAGLFHDVKQLVKGNVLLNEAMSFHTSWRIGGPADILVEPRDTEDLSLLVEYAGRYGVSLTVVGGGSNILVRDGGIRGIVVKISGVLSEISVDGDIITAGGGARLSRLAAAARDAGLGSFEFMAGIPGTVGGAVVMNAGANGSCTGNLVTEVAIIDLAGNLLRLPGGQLGWGYRKSNLQSGGRIVVEAVFKGIFRDRDLINEDMESFLHRRRATQPLNYPNSGSVFRNPPDNYAGRLIQDTGCQGMRVGDAQVSSKHANFIVNLGRARAVDVLELIDAVKERVLTKTGVSLEMEVEVLGHD